MAINFNNYELTNDETREATRKRINRSSKYDALLKDFMSAGIVSVSVPIEDILEGEKPAIQSVLVGLRNSAVKLELDDKFSCSKDYIREGNVVLSNQLLLAEQQ